MEVVPEFLKGPQDLKKIKVYYAVVTIYMARPRYKQIHTNASGQLQRKKDYKMTSG